VEASTDDRLRLLRQELTELASQQTATVEILNAISQSAFDLAAVFETLARNAVTLCRADAVQLYRFDGDAYRVVAHFGGPPAYVEFLPRLVVLPGKETVIGKAVLERRTVHVPDVLADEDYWFPELQRRGGYRTLLGVPMMSDDVPIGAIGIWRTAIDPFTEKEIEVVETFAAHGAVAIVQVELVGQLEEKNRQLEVASRHKSEFLAQMSHELRTPLNAVIGFSEVLLERLFGELNEKQEEYLRDILGSGRHLLSLINDVLDVSRVEAGRMELEFRDLDVERVIEDALVLVREQAAKRGQTVALDVDADVPQARADERRIKQVVANLVGNAVKFTPEGGRIVVGARCVDDTVQVFVSDNGIGVAAGDQERIFEAFSQASAGPQPKPEGTGLGLTLSRQIVELHGGRLWLESRAGEGSTFTFSLPTRPGTTTPATAAPDRPGVDAGAGGRTVLLVEDDEHSIELLSLYLQDSGFDVVVARSGEEGLALARRLRPQGIVLDILLPGLDGWEFLARSKVDPAIAEIPVIIVSMVDERGRGLALGAADYLVKPIARGDLLGALSRVTGASQATVLTIDDDPLALELASAVLEPAGYMVLTARTGSNGVALARSAQPDVILLDLVMPEVDGFAVVEQLRADPRTSSIPIVVLTSKTLTTEDERRLRGRIASLAQKGELDRHALLELLDRCILAKAP
jgi:signal transduction histidine kinase/DNA-binding response OmpR family regulator